MLTFPLVAKALADVTVRVFAVGTDAIVYSPLIAFPPVKFICRSSPTFIP